ncbi:type 1 glutamine amidotransferase [Chthonobacter rhizosphaerae]|uniref:type 1 glutamine amidotransferase n=1 Tax=Chthonobacter rhizosphaerae TaxID=2735553 RepID=UPI0015EF5533|nr:type 1 glutamine amidotransferase [Chthonobacter rhizosphaerae]
MRILVVENYAGTHLGLVARALAEAEAEVDLRLMYKGDPLPETSGGYDGLVVLGGGQNALADDEHPYLPALARLTRAFGADDKAVLGICLGSQVVARGHGATNILGRPIEIGWKTVTPTDEGRRDPVISALGDGAPLFHWHTDTFTLPPDAIHLASSEQTANQAFRIGRAVYGIQFHFEADRTLVSEWTNGYPHLLKGDAAEWPARHERDRHTLGATADATGLEVARAWVKLAR